MLNATNHDKVLEALRLIEEAQNTLYHAAQCLCSVPEFGQEYEKACKLGDAVKTSWYRLDDKRQARRPVTHTVAPVHPVQEKLIEAQVLQQTGAEWG